jgi:hypothetical protein
VSGRRTSPRRRPSRFAPAPALLTAPLLALALALTAAPLALAHGNGETVEITGVVTGADGKPLADVQVVLEASRSVFSFRHFQRETDHTTRLTALTDASGQYTLEWPWNSYYNSFELAVGVPVRKADGERFEALERIDLTQRIKKASPLVVAVVVQNADFVVALRKFLAGVTSDDERKVYREMGKPDKVEERVDGEGGGRGEAAWWYFESGRVYRFRAGVLEGVEKFDPVKDF